METTDSSKVTLIECLGSDLTIVNAARVSFGKKKSVFDEKVDGALLTYLAQHQHYSPFRHAMLQFHIECPEFVARQLYKHVVGIETTSTHPTKDHAWNEVSGRYIKLSRFYRPAAWRTQSKSNKQGSDGPAPRATQNDAFAAYDYALDEMWKVYQNLIEMGIAREQARIILPMSFMTEFYWTASFQAVMNFIQLRNAPDAQGEIQELAQQVDKITFNAFPHAYRAWKNAQ